MKRNRLSSFCLTCLLSVMIWGAGLSMPAKIQAQSNTLPANVCVISKELTTTTFPKMQIGFRVVDSKFNSVSSLGQDAFSIRDNNADLKPSSVSVNPFGVGINLYFVIDQGNRTDHDVTEKVLRRYAETYMKDGVDRVTVLTNLKRDKQKNPYIAVDATSSAASFQGSIANLTDSTQAYLPVDDVIQEAYSQIRNDNFGCTRPSMVVTIIGQDEIIGDQVYSSLSKLALQASAPLHLVQTYRNGFVGQDEYRKLAETTYGIYSQVKPDATAQFTQLDKTLFEPVIASRQTYTAVFSTTDGSSGVHTVNVYLSNQGETTQSSVSRYNISLKAPQVTIKTPTNDIVIKRTAKQSVGADYIYDIDIQRVEFEVGWQDGFPRRISSTDVILSDANGVTTLKHFDGGDSTSFQFDWDLKQFKAKGDSPVSLTVKVIDQFGYSVTTDPVNVRITNVIPDLGQPASQQTQIQFYIMYAVIAVLIILIILMRRQIGRLASGGKIGQVINQLRKTLVGGGRRGKPLAKLKVIDGPANMIDQELMIYTESVRLGRDPQRSDLTFYTPDSNSSISGLHAKIERANGIWRIVALSTSGSETFVDNRAIPFNEPVNIRNHQKIRLGYLAQQPVELLFDLEEGDPPKKNDGDSDPRKTDVGEAKNGVKPIVKIGAKKKSDQNSTSDSVFDEYR